MKVIIGVDVGGTKTNIGIYDLQGTQIQNYIAQGTNLANDKELAIEIVDLAILHALALIDNAEVVSISIGMAGVVNHPLLPQFIATLETKHECPIRVYNDVVFAHKAIFKNQTGLLLSAGTGSVAVIKYADEYDIIGGYGHLFGDEASGYDIAKRGLVYCMQQHDFHKRDAFTDEILSALAVPNIRAAVPQLYKANKAEIAQLSLVIDALAQNQNPVAISILQQSALAYIDHIIAAIKAVAVVPEQYAFWGSVLQNNPYVTRVMETRLEQAFACKVVETTGIDITKAAFYDYQ